MSLRLGCLVLASVTACGDGGASPVFAELPSRFHVRGVASAVDAAGGRVDCDLDLIVELSGVTARTVSTVEYAATHGGHVGRSVLDSTGAGLAIFADVHWPNTVVRFIPPDSVELLLGDSSAVNEGRFWRALAFLAGRTAAGGEAPWICLPLDINHGGYVDTVGTAPGTWRIVRP